MLAWSTAEIEWRGVPFLYFFIGLIFARSYARFAMERRSVKDGTFDLAVGAMWVFWPMALLMVILTGLGMLAVKTVGKVSE